MNQKQEEIVVMEYFRSKLVGFPAGKLIKSESPDFILKLNSGKRIGIELTRLKENNHNNHNHEYVVPEITQQNLEATILGKEEKIDLYLGKKFSEIWLIITVDFFRSAMPVSTALNVFEHSYSSSFAKLFLFELMEGKIFRINHKREFEK